MKISTLRFKALAFVTALCAGLALAPSTQAAAYELSGSVQYDTGFAAGNVAGSLDANFSGNPQSSSFVGASVAGANPLAGLLTQAGDRIGFSGTASAQANDGDFAAGVDYSLSLFNASVNTWRFSFTATYDLRVDSSGGDAYADSEFSLADGNGELFGTRLSSDTLNGNRIDGQLQAPPNGGPLARNGSVVFDIDVLAGTTADLSGFWTLTGGSFDDPGSADAFIEFFLTLDAITLVGANPVPAPGTLSLLALALAGLAARRRA